MQYEREKNWSHPVPQGENALFRKPKPRTSFSDIGAVILSGTIVAGLHVMDTMNGKAIPEDSNLGEIVYPLGQQYAEQAAEYDSWGELYATYEPPQGASPYEYKTPLDEIRDTIRVTIEQFDCKDKSILEVDEPAWGTGITHMVANVDLRVDNNCHVNKSK